MVVPQPLLWFDFYFLFTSRGSKSPRNMGSLSLSRGMWSITAKTSERGTPIRSMGADVPVHF